LPNLPGRNNPTAVTALIGRGAVSGWCDQMFHTSGAIGKIVRDLATIGADLNFCRWFSDYCFASADNPTVRA